MTNVNVKLDEFSRHEALDRSSMILNIIDTHLLQHPVIKLDKELKEKVTKSAELLYEVYQELGSKM